MTNACPDAASDAGSASEFHVAGIVVYAEPSLRDSIIQAIGMLPAAQVHAVTQDARLVVTLEASESARVVDQLDAIQALPGVYSAALVYQHHEDIDSLNEEIVDEADSS